MESPSILRSTTFLQTTLPRTTGGVASISILQVITKFITITLLVTQHRPMLMAGAVMYLTWINLLEATTGATGLLLIAMGMALSIFLLYFLAVKTTFPQWNNIIVHLLFHQEAEMLVRSVSPYLAVTLWMVQAQSL